jgi:2-polyprenyl-6-methoxyphenol hydroxylase-like FAD-dependent oxidoreductase
LGDRAKSFWRLINVGLFMHVGVLGGGLQGCCIALALAERGIAVTLFDRNKTLLSRTAVANEGKIHLGYMYASDTTLSTAKTMMVGAFAFAPFFERHLGRPAQKLAVSNPATYVVHRDSQHTVEAVSAYLNTVHGMIVEYANSGSRVYLNKILPAQLRPWSGAEIDAEFDSEIALAAFDSPEVAVDPVDLARRLREAISDHPKIEICCNRQVLGAQKEERAIGVDCDGPEGPARSRFNHVVNALWDGRLGLNEAIGLQTKRPWLYRLKYGVTFRLPACMKSPPSATIVSGPFGEVVSYADRLTYLTWYPDCMQAISTDLMPPDWPTYAGEPLRSRVLTGTLRALTNIMPSLSGLDADDLPEACVKGGVIVAWGQTDIYDPKSELHRRYEIGVTSAGRFHSVDPGKLTMAPYFAEICAERISQAN